MSAENQQRLGWLGIVIPNETPDEDVNGLVFEVADYILEEVAYKSDDFTRVGTLVEATLMATGFRDLAPKESLDAVQKSERERIDEMKPDFEFDRS